ncbi:hypothetical protein [Streptomyces anulatus]|uniref:hypothetical protein n=1 Tax=Streptomyces anulatus TaxID=1892 RepID=UPI0036DF2D29
MPTILGVTPSVTPNVTSRVTPYVTPGRTARPLPGRRASSGLRRGFTWRQPVVSSGRTVL